MDKYLHLGNLLLIIVMVILLVYFGRAMRNSQPEVVFSNTEALWFYFLGLVTVLISLGIIVYYLSYKPKIKIPVDVLKDLQKDNEPKVERSKQNRLNRQVKTKKLADVENENDVKPCPLAKSREENIVIKTPENVADENCTPCGTTIAPTLSKPEKLDSPSPGELCYVVKSEPVNNTKLTSFMP